MSPHRRPGAARSAAMFRTRMKVRIQYFSLPRVHCAAVWRAHCTTKPLDTGRYMYGACKNTLGVPRQPSETSVITCFGGGLEFSRTTTVRACAMSRMHRRQPRHPACGAAAPHLDGGASRQRCKITAQRKRRLAEHSPLPANTQVGGLRVTYSAHTVAGTDPDGYKKDNQVGTSTVLVCHLQEACMALCEAGQSFVHGACMGHLGACVTRPCRMRGLCRMHGLFASG